MKIYISKYTKTSLQKILDNSVALIKRYNSRLTDEHYYWMLKSLERRKDTFDEDEYQDAIKALQQRHETDPSEDDIKSELDAAKNDFTKGVLFLENKCKHEIHNISNILSDINVECWISASINDEKLIHEIENAIIHYNLFFKNDDSNITISYTYDENGKREILDELEVFGGDWDEEDSELESLYANTLDILRNNKPLKPFITLYRHMSYEEYDKWEAGEIIPKGKYFTSLKTSSFAPDDERFNKGERMRFSIDRKIVAQTADNIYQLTNDAKFIGGKIVNTKINESKFNTVYYSLV